MKLTNKEQLTLLKVKSLLNHLDYIIKDEHKEVVSDFHKLCRKLAPFGRFKKFRKNIKIKKHIA